MPQPVTSSKLEALRASRATAIDAQHEREIEDEIRREEEHLRTCPFAKGERDPNEQDHMRQLAARNIDAIVFEANVAEALGLSKHASKAEILKAIEDLKRAKAKAQADADDQLRWRARDHAALAEVFGARPECSVQHVLDAAKQTRAEVARLTKLAIDRGDAINRLLAILKAPLRYEGGIPLTQEERIEWALRHAPKD